VTERLAVVGGDAAGMSAAAIARRRDPDLEIFAFERGPYTSYSACGIPYYVAGELGDVDELVARSPEEFRESGIDTRTFSEVVGIDLDRRRLTVLDLDSRREYEEGFDRLVYATGAEAVPPPIEGADALEPVLKLDSAERFRAEVSHGEARHAVVIGASYLGLEMAEALVKRGLDVVLLDQADQVMTTLDADMASHIKHAAEGVGIRVLLSTTVEEVVTDEDGRPCLVRTREEGDLKAEHVVLSTGVRPAVGLAEEAGIELGESGAVRTDDHQRCPGHDGVFSAGDCAESRHRLTGRGVNIQLGTHANKQGRVAGVNASGGDATFPGVIGTAVSRICKYEVARTGLSERDATAEGIEVAAATIKDKTRAGYYPGAGPIWVKLVVEPGEGRILGGQIVGEEGAAKRIDVLATCVWTGLRAAELEQLDLSYAPPFSGVYDPLLRAAHRAAQAAERT
jgi:NADPH-dependent 2,4-dienoyl-CoA reductase/sulfur reductase-like enzyme